MRWSSRMLDLHHSFAHSVQHWLVHELPLLKYIFKYMLAIALALMLSLSMEIELPGTALLTVVIVMHFRSGMVLTKSYYRMIGTLIGIVVSLILLAMFVQDRFPFLFAMSVWIGCCTACSMIYRNFQSYGFVLAGYTLCIVGLPATLAPEQTFQIATTRMSEILIGLFSATLVSEVVFPQRIWESVKALASRRLLQMSRLMQSINVDVSRPLLVNFLQDIYQLESFRASAGFETDDSRVLGATMHQLNLQLMRVTTRYILLQRHFARLNLSGGHQVDVMLYADWMQLAHMTKFAFIPEDVAPFLKQRIQHLADLQSKWMHLETDPKPQVEKLDVQEMLDYEAGKEMISALTQALLDYLTTHARLMGISEEDVLNAEDESQSLHFHIDPLPLAVAALRGMVTLAMIAVFWIATDWPSGMMAITLGTITTALFASSHSPTKTVQYFSLGVLSGILCAFVTNFYWLPQAHNAVMLYLVLSPALIVTAWLSATPALTLSGAGMGIAYLLLVSVNQQLNVNPLQYFNDAVAIIVALAVSAMLFSLMQVTGSRWLAIRVLKQLRQQLIRCFEGSFSLSRTVFDMHVRDLIHRSGVLYGAKLPLQKSIVASLFTTLDIGHQVLLLRHTLLQLPHPLNNVLGNVLQRVSDFYRMPDERRQQQAVLAAQSCLTFLKREYEDGVMPASLYRTLTLCLHRVRSIVQSEKVNMTLIFAQPGAKER